MELDKASLDAIAQEARSCFLDEDAPDYLSMLEQGVRQLRIGETTGDGAREAEYAALIRAAHSLKGGAGIANLPNLMHLAHQLEDLLEALQQGRVQERSSAYELLELSVEEVNSQLAAAISGYEVPVSPISEALDLFLQDLPATSPTNADDEVNSSNAYLVQTALNVDLEDCLQRVERLLQSPDATTKVRQALSTLTEECLLLGQAFGLSWLKETADLIQQTVAVAHSPVQQIAKVAIAEIRQLRSQFLSKEKSQCTPTPSRSLQKLAQPKEEDNGTRERLMKTSPPLRVPPCPPIPRGGPESPPPPPSPTSLNLRIPVDRLDRMSNTVSELLISYERLSLYQQQLLSSSLVLGLRATQLDPIWEQVQSFYDQLATPFAAALTTGSEFDPLQFDHYTRLHRTLQDFQEFMVQVQETKADVELLARELQAALDEVRSSVGSLRRDLTESRLVPFGFLAERFLQPLQDLNKRYHKTAQLKLVGKDTLIDQVILEQLQNPLTQLLRNAFDHGIEHPEERLASGKSSTACITLCAVVQGNQVVVTVEDDGRGIDTQKVYYRAVQLGLCDSTAKLNSEQILEFLFQPSFSTAATVTSLSGRGMGLDIVRLNLQRLRGSVDVKTVLGQGTKFTISVPLSLNILPLLLCRSGQRTLAIPSISIREIIRLCEFESDKSNEDGFITWHEQKVPVFSLVQILPYRRPVVSPIVKSHFDEVKARSGGSLRENVDHPLGIVLDVRGQLVVVTVDDLLGERELVLKPFEPAVPIPSYLAGCTVLGTGEVVPVLSPMHMGELLSSPAPSACPDLLPMATTDTPTILIVDDSVAVRRSLDLILSHAGYQVVQCRNGREALAALSRSGGHFSLVISDIEMPSMDGFALLKEVRSHPSWHNLPVALLTSRSSDRHREKADSLGATAYFTKPFQPTQLVSAIAALLN